jgi:hypothetical protein
VHFAGGPGFYGHPYWGRGFWGWHGSSWVWFGGPYWTTPLYPGWVWIAPQWVWDGNEWVWEDGYWSPSE